MWFSPFESEIFKQLENNFLSSGINMAGRWVKIPRPTLKIDAQQSQRHLSTKKATSTQPKTWEVLESLIFGTSFFAEVLH